MYKDSFIAFLVCKSNQEYKYRGIITISSQEGNRALLFKQISLSASFMENSSQLAGMMGQLPFQVDTTLPTLEEEGSTKILSRASTAKSGTNSTFCYSHSQEVFMLPQPPQHLDVNSDDEPLEDISDDIPAPDAKSEIDKALQLKKNRHKQARRNHATHRKEALERYEANR